MENQREKRFRVNIILAHCCHLRIHYRLQIDLQEDCTYGIANG